ncbi:MAG: hypothetical protein AVDCRST_MAG50-1345 [uncultured Acidimicrobiales bacterium]|uniref:Putative Flp pilus-assembly TadG-like N-terminal domain-containing protein n=1 Tax=uncultured Acidimicrobiales bacterium TaxID=310071 RepID=A0A6J4HVU3_9ACTN|nr:MAG: hypothetical protein AVDCRST_MAG50-1345 [uncultured Acidimicrobiales bacterium]
MPLLVLVVLVACLTVLGIARIGAVAVSRAEARTAADAAALAGASAGRVEADNAAIANGARLVDFTQDGDEVEVEVRNDRATARARARSAASGPSSPPTQLH